MLTSYLEYVFLLVFVMLSVMAYNNWKHFKGISFLFAFFVIYLFEQVIQSYLVFSVDRSFLPLFYYNFSPLFFLKAPLYLFFVKYVLVQNLKLKWYDSLHLLPFLYKLIDLIPYYLTPYSYKIELTSKVLSNYLDFPYVNLYTIFPQQYELILRNLQLFVYLLYVLFLIKNRSKQMSNKEGVVVLKDNTIRKWLTLITSFLLVTSVTNLISVSLFCYLGDRYSVYKDLVEMLFVFGLSVLVLLPILFVIFPNLVFGFLVPMEKSAKKPNNLLPGSEPIANRLLQVVAQFHQNNQSEFSQVNYLISQKILTLFIEQKPYLKFDFKVEDLSDMLELPKYMILPKNWT